MELFISLDVVSERECLAFLYALFFFRDMRLTFPFIRGWLKRAEVILLGTLSSNRLELNSLKGFQRVLTSVPGVQCEVNSFEKLSTFGFKFAISACFHKSIFRCGGLVLAALVLASTKTISWSLTPSSGLHFSTRLDLLVRKTSSVFSPLVGNLTRCRILCLKDTGSY